MRHKATSSSFKTRFATHVSSEPTLIAQPAQTCETCNCFHGSRTMAKAKFPDLASSETIPSDMTGREHD
ncbi:hypothetical protein AD942_08590 [Gluconobacter japonicus]|nr:hypothetical protein AD936_14130 [Gluconobacter japonicus]KXV39859.1 hypothetical protein AD942_08590 [Gluconobacter japonicus]